MAIRPACSCVMANVWAYNVCMDLIVSVLWRGRVEPLNPMIHHRTTGINQRGSMSYTVTDGSSHSQGGPALLGHMQGSVVLVD